MSYGINRTAPIVRLVSMPAVSSRAKSRPTCRSCSQPSLSSSSISRRPRRSAYRRARPRWRLSRRVGGGGERRVRHAGWRPRFRTLGGSSMIPMVLQRAFRGIQPFLQQADIAAVSSLWRDDARYGKTREAAIVAFVKSWRYESRQRRVNRAETITMAPSGTSYG
jgi:hypothetical protein